MDYRLDDIDKRILYHLARDARNTSAPDIAAEVNVSSGTIRNRIDQLEQHGIIRGYHAHVDYERAEGMLTTLFMCDVSVSEREVLGRQLLDISGVVNVREIVTGSQGHGLRVKAVGADTDDITRIGREIEDLGITIAEEVLIQREYFHPYDSYGPDETPQQPMTNFMSLAGDAEVVDVTVTEGAPIAGKTLADANADGLLDEDVLVVAIEREETVLTPHGETTVEPGDVVTVLSPDGMTRGIVETFTEAPSA